MARKKVKKLAAHISPLSTGRATNSRAGSEVINHFDHDDEPADSPASASGQSKTSSRDASPLVSGTETSIGLGVDLSEREKRKIQEQERLFARLEQDGSRRKKRNSAGSTLNTPAAPVSVGSNIKMINHHITNDIKQKHVGNVDSFNPSPTSATNKPRVNGRTSADPKQRAMHNSRLPTTKPPSLSSRTYSESSTQTEGAAEEEQVDVQLLQQRRAFGCNYAQRLLIRSRKTKPRGISTSASPAKDEASHRPHQSSTPTDRALSPMKSNMNTPPRPEPAKQMPPPPKPVAAKESNHTFSSAPMPTVHLEPAKPDSEDVEMEDQPQLETALLRASQPSLNTEDKESPTNASQSNNHAPKADISSSDSPSNKLSKLSVSIDVAAISKPDFEETTQKASGDDLVSPKPALKVELPTPLSSASQPVEITQTQTSDSNPSAESTNLIIKSPDSASSEAPNMERSPTMLKAVLSSSIASTPTDMAAPSTTPGRKKMSLSDWSNRNKKKQKAAEQQAAHISPLFTVSTTSGVDDVTMKSPVDDSKPELVTEVSLDSLSATDNIHENGASSPAANVDELLQQAMNASELPDNAQPITKEIADSAMDIDPKPMIPNHSDSAAVATPIV